MLEAISPRPLPPGQAEPGASYTEEQIQAMQRAVLNLLERWNVADVDAAVILGGISARTLRRWRDGELGRVSRDMADRISHLLAIHKSLRILFEETRRGYDWMSTGNEAFGGRSALDILRRGGMEDIVRVRAYLDAVRGGW
jgi:uncharacterized protein (DUF2384 family)